MTTVRSLLLPIFVAAAYFPVTAAFIPVCALAQTKLNIKIGPCSSNTAQVCARVVDGSADREIELFTGTLDIVEAGGMGTFQFNGQPHELAYIYGSATSPTLNGGLSGNAEVSIIDLTAGRQIAFVASPNGYLPSNTYFQYITDPAGRKYPFLAPGAHYLAGINDLAKKRNAAWDSLCLFDPAYIANPSQSCDTGFKPYSATFADAAALAVFRHDGGWVEDIDRDGWSDIHLPFLGYILSLSGKTGKQLGLAHFDVAAKEQPSGLGYPFHGGRFYGGFSAFADAGGNRYVLFADANAVGSFRDQNCNVSRYFAVAKWRGTSLDLKWSRYLSFSKTIFKPPYNSVTDYWRLGDELNNCVHRFGTSLTYFDNRAYIIYDLFKKDNPAPECEAEVMAEQKANFTNATTDASNACRNKKGLEVAGRWSANILDADTGAVAWTQPNLYVWGSATHVMPGTDQTLLAQQLTSNGGSVRFDQTGNSIDSFVIAKVSSGPVLAIAATLPSPPAPPVVTEGNQDGVNGAYPPGFGAAYRGQPLLVLKDIDRDGLNDIELSNGQWLGWSVPRQQLIIKSSRTIPN